MLIEYMPTTEYFENFVEFDSKIDILDFGSNWGNLLRSNKIISEIQYTGVDVDEQAIRVGKKIFPNATWLWYNRFNPAYNPTGNNDMPKFAKKFDMILSYSVFSHTTQEDMIEIIDILYDSLNSNGVMCFTYCNIDNRTLVEWFRKRRDNCDEIPTDKDYVYLADNKLTEEYPKEKCIHFVSFYKESYMLNILQKFNPESYSSPGGRWGQDCIIIRKK